MERRYYIWIAFILIFITGTILRFYHLDFQCMAWDEEFTRNMALHDIPYIISVSFTVDPNPPLYYLLAHYMIEFFGNTLWNIRFPSMVFGILSMPLVYLIGKEYYNDLLGLAMMFYVAVSYNLILYSQFARAYMMAFLMFSVFILAFVRYEKTKEPKYLLVMAVFSAITAWAHAYSIIPLGLIWLYLLYTYRKKVMWYFGLMLFWCLPFALYVFILGKRSTQHFGGTVEQIVTIIPLELFWIPCIVIGPLFIWQMYKMRKEGSPWLFLGAVSFVTIVSTIPISLVNPVFPRYVLLVVPIILVIALKPIVERMERQVAFDRRVAVVMAYCFLLVLCSYTPLIAWYFIGTCPYGVK